MASDSKAGDKGVPTQLGRYRLHYKIASGGMASVWLARATGANAFEKVVAIKTVHAHLTAEPSAIRMFIDEARIASAIQHPNVCHVFDFGEEKGTHYLVMEYLVGESVSRILKRLSSSKDPAWKDQLSAFAARIIADAAEGLHAAHELKDDQGVPMDVVHRDVSPQNIFVTYDGAVKVVDFGIAKARAKLEQTRTGDFKGKFEYVAPEQIRNKAIDRRADLWALGVCLWELLTLKRLFRRDETAAIIAAVALDPVPPPSKYNKAIPQELEAIVLKALERDVTKRFQTARELSKALRGWLARTGEVVEAAEVGEWMSRLFPEDKAKRFAARDRVMEGGEEPASMTPPSLPSFLAVSSPGGTGQEMIPDIVLTAADQKTPVPVATPSRLPLVVGLAVLVLLAVGAAVGWKAFQKKDESAAEVAQVEAQEAAERAEAARAAKEKAGAVKAVADTVAAEKAAADTVAVEKAAADTVAAEKAAADTVAAEKAAADTVAVEKAAAEKAASEKAAADKAASDTIAAEKLSAEKASAARKVGVAAKPKDELVAKATTPRPPPKDPPKPPPSTGPTKRFGDSSGGTGRVLIKGAPGQFDVFIDGQLVGKTPLNVDVSVGDHQLEIREPGTKAGPVQMLKVKLASEYVIELN